MGDQIGVFAFSAEPYGRRLKRVLAAAPDLAVVGVSPEPQEAVFAAGYPSGLQVAVVDLALPQAAASEFWMDLNTFCRRAEVVVVAVLSLPAEVLRLAWQARAKGWVLKTDAPDALYTAVRQAHARWPYLRNPRLIVALANVFDKSRSERWLAAQLQLLTPRQREVLGRVAQGQPNKVIAAGLGLSDGTVSQHLRVVYATLGVKNRTEAGALYMRAAQGADTPARRLLHKGAIADELLTRIIGDEEERGKAET